MATSTPTRRSRSTTRPNKTAAKRQRRSNSRAAKVESRAVVSTEAWTLRRWEAGETNRLNRAHWQNATGQTINADLAGNLKTLRARCAYEASNNPIVEGMIQSHAVDIVGPDGPTLDVLSDSEEFNEQLESLWGDWWNPGPLSGNPKPDAAGLLSGPDMLRQSVWLWWTKGEHVVQLTSDPAVALDHVALRFQSIDPDRLDTDPHHAGDPRVALGVRRTKAGRPIQYMIADLIESGPFSLFGYDYTHYSADEIIHQFECLEPGQVRGVPWLASALQTIAELRDYDKQVLDAARAAAALGVVWWTDHPDAQYHEVNETTEVERNKQWTGPPGWKPELIDPKQPAAQYVQFRTERLRELGRGRSIPLMKILLGSERHNFASARMDNQNYQRSCEAIQSWTERFTLNRLLATFLRELILLTRNGRFVLPPRPERIPVRWHWPTQPHVDPLKESNAQRIRLETGTLSYAAACAADGADEDTVIASRARSAKKLKAAGLPPVPTAQPRAGPRPQDDGLDGDELDDIAAPDDGATVDNG